MNQKEQQPVQVWSAIVKGMIATIEKDVNERQTTERKGGHRSNVRRKCSMEVQTPSSIKDVYGEYCKQTRRS